ncbi:MAG: SIS domain-containing protein, partial [Chloroflexi bacterium]|nr:SIS domain-containing protein [Chloroflexota bacterium]
MTADRWATESRARAFQADLDAKPEALARLAAELPRDRVIPTLPLAPRRIVLLGMGSSGYAAGITAGRLRAAGLDAVSELASAAVGTPAAPDTLVLAISATGGSIETLAAVERHRGTSQVVAVTNTPASALA